MKSFLPQAAFVEGRRKVTDRNIVYNISQVRDSPNAHQQWILISKLYINLMDYYVTIEKNEVYTSLIYMYIYIYIYIYTYIYTYISHQDILLRSMHLLVYCCFVCLFVSTAGIKPRA
jgi:hypothetical protein